MNSLYTPIRRVDESLVDPSPRVLKSAARSGTGKDFGTVVLPHMAEAYSLARWLTGNHADSQDVVQDACLRALNGLGNFADGDARAWVLTIVRRSACDWLNKNRRSNMVFTEDLDGMEHTQPPEQGAGTAESWLIDREREMLFENAIEALPAHYRQPIELRHWQGLTYGEIARVTGISIGTVMSRLSRARRHLIKRMARNSSLGRGRRAVAGCRSVRVHSESLSASFKDSIGQGSRPGASSRPPSQCDSLPVRRQFRRGA